MAQISDKGSDYADMMQAYGMHMIVLRFRSLYPKDVADMVKHGKREIGDQSHCDPARRHLNRVLVGSNDIAKEIEAQEALLRLSNHTSNLEGTHKTRGANAAEQVMLAGAKPPWKESKNSQGPLREAIMTIHRDHFRADDDCPPEDLLEFLDDKGKLAQFDIGKCDAFVDEGLAFLQHNFGDMLKYCRVDMDEQAIHLHALIYDIVELPKSARYANGRSLFRSALHPLLCSTRDAENKSGYERAQDAVGEWFRDPGRRHMNIARGEPRAEARREAEAEGHNAIEVVQAMDLSDLYSHDPDLLARDPIPAGSERARMIWAIKEQSEVLSELKKPRLDERQKTAIEILVAGGFVTHEEQEEARTRRLRKALLQEHEEAFGTPDDIISNPDKIIAKLEEQSDGLDKKKASLEKARAELDRKEAELEAAQNALAKSQEDLKTDRLTFGDKEQAFERGLEAVEQGEIQFRPADGETNERLVYGPDAPKDDADRKALWQSVKSASGIIMAYARRIWQSEPATCQRAIEKDPSLIDVKVTPKIDPAAEPDDALTMDIEVELKGLEKFSKPMGRIINTIANTIAKRVGDVVVKRARKEMRSELQSLTQYHEGVQKAYGGVQDPELLRQIALARNNLSHLLRKPPQAPRGKRPPKDKSGEYTIE
ncbi:hypothetical protein [Cohaesibacter intestini]|uniref:hypothetical protein n=1 Tax=Cohaesibacter intestini TaxID=2211145 RepID=UPI000DEA76EC|nr:hypothetical protein [Cohaesibacter intestini]